MKRRGTVHDTAQTSDEGERNRHAQKSVFLELIVSVSLGGESSYREPSEGIAVDHFCLLSETGLSRRWKFKQVYARTRLLLRLVACPSLRTQV